MSYESDDAGRTGGRVVVMLEMPSPTTREAAPAAVIPIEDKVREALQCIESGHDSHQEWILINKLYRALRSKKKLSERGHNLIKMIEPVLAHFGYHKVDGGRS